MQMRQLAQGHIASTPNSKHIKYFYPANARSARAKGLCAESARAVTGSGRRCPHSGEGEDFLTGQLIFFTETAVTPERKVENRSQGGKLTVMPRAINGSSTKIGVVWQKSDFWPKTEILGPKKGSHFW